MNKPETLEYRMPILVERSWANSIEEAAKKSGFRSRSEYIRVVMKNESDKVLSKESKFESKLNAYQKEVLENFKRYKSQADKVFSEYLETGDKGLIQFYTDLQLTIKNELLKLSENIEKH